MHVTKMHIAFLNSLSTDGANSPLGKRIIGTIHMHDVVMRKQAEEAQTKRLAKEKETARLATSLDVA